MVKLLLENMSEVEGVISEDFNFYIPNFAGEHPTVNIWQQFGSSRISEKDICLHGCASIPLQNESVLQTLVFAGLKFGVP